VKYLDEYRDAQAVKTLARAIEDEVRHGPATPDDPYVVMEVCGGQTHAIVRHGLDRMLPSAVELVHGPGCPVCVTPLEMIDRAHTIALRPEVVLCSFGDMLRVPGSHGDLLGLKARGADVRVVYSPLDALAVARAEPQREVVFFAVGFETTAPANAMALVAAKKQRQPNFSVLSSQVLVPPAITSILQAAECRVRGFLGPGHVCTVMGIREYQPIVERYGVPMVIAGFEPVDILEAILSVVRQLNAGRAAVDIQYGRVVRPEGNPHARALIDEVFEICDRKWRGMGSIPKSGLKLRYEYRDYDATRRFELEAVDVREASDCISGLVLKGVKKPGDCPAFGSRCTPDTPLGATMVSSEGACAAYHAYRAVAPRPIELRRAP
jgi:hydrogenase expression/formation protein HypD